MKARGGRGERTFLPALQTKTVNTGIICNRCLVSGFTGRRRADCKGEVFPTDYRTADYRTAMQATLRDRDGHCEENQAVKWTKVVAHTLFWIVSSCGKINVEMFDDDGTR